MYVCVWRQAGGNKSLRTTISTPNSAYIHVDSSANKFNVALMEEEIADLKKSLRRAESRLVCSIIPHSYIRCIVLL